MRAACTSGLVQHFAARTRPVCCTSQQCAQCGAVVSDESQYGAVSDGGLEGASRSSVGAVGSQHPMQNDESTAHTAACTAVQYGRPVTMIATRLLVQFKAQVESGWTIT